MNYQSFKRFWLAMLGQTPRGGYLHQVIAGDEVHWVSKIAVGPSHEGAIVIMKLSCQCNCVTINAL